SVWINFYPRSPRGERRPAHSAGPGRKYFYPRSPRGERRRCAAGQSRPTDFYPRSPRGERLIFHLLFCGGFLFLSTLPARGATPGWRRGTAPLWKFLSTLPARGATRGGGLGRRIQQDFYPRSPRGERHRRAGGLGSLSYFYPRSPRGERPNALNHFGLRAEFLSTL